MHSFCARVVALTELDLLVAPEGELVGHRALGYWLE